MAFPTTAGSLAAWTDQNANIPGTGTKANATNLNLLITEVNAITNTLGASALALSNLAEDPATTTALIWGYQAGRVVEDNVVRTIAAGTVNLTNNATNYIEFSAANDTMYVNQSAFTSGRKPIAKVITSGGFITQTVALRDQRTWLMVYAGAPVFAGSNYTITGTWTWGAHLLFTDNTYDIGASGATRPRTGYFGTSVVSPVLTAATSLTTPTIYGSAAAGGTLSLISTSGTGSNDAVHIKGGTNGGTTIASFFGAGTYAGNVGIGTTGPLGKLEVNGIINTSAAKIGGASAGDIVIPAGNAFRSAHPTTSTNATYTLAKIANSVIEIGDASWELSLLAATKVYTLGNVGIGTTGPASTLDVRGTFRAGTPVASVTNLFGQVFIYAPSSAIGSSTGNNLALVANDATPAIDLGAKLSFYAHGPTGANLNQEYAVIKGARAQADSDINANIGYLAFAVSSASSAVEERMRIIGGTGNVGIGTTAPGSQLHIYDDSNNSATNIANYTGGLTVENYNQGVANAGSYSAMRFKTATNDYLYLKAIQNADNDADLYIGKCNSNSGVSTDKLVIKESGNVGIGTTGPASLTEIQGGLTTVGAVLTLGSKETSTVVNDVLGRINFYAPLDAAGTDAILVAGSIAAVAEGTFSATSNATSLIFQTGASEVATTKMTIASTGLVTISSGLVVSASGITSTGSVIHHTLDSASTGTALIIDGSDIIRPLTSAERYKENIRRDWQTDTEAFFALSPILFDYKNGGARDVLSFSADQSMALPYLVNRNNDGLPESLREHAFIVYLFNAAKKDHARIAELERQVKQLSGHNQCV